MAGLARPSGPRSTGVVGNFPMGQPDPLGVYTQWEREFGGIYYYRFLHRQVYVLNDPALVKQVLLTDYQNFIKGQALRFNRRIFGNGLLTSEGSSWLQQRRLIQPAFHRTKIEIYARSMVLHTQAMLDRWQNADELDIHEEMMQTALAIVSEVLFDVEIAAERGRFSNALSTVLALSTGARLLLPPLLRLVPTPGNIQFLRAVRELDAIVYALIRQRRANRRPGDDLLWALLETRDERGAAMPDQQVRDEVMTLLLAGHETTAVTLSWAWYLLARHPEVERMLWDELAVVLGGRLPQAADMAMLPYTEGVVKETMRLYPAIWALVRTPRQDCEIGGYTVPAGSSVMLSQWVMHRNPKFWDEPEEFRPQRWLEERVKSMPKFAYFPFSGGPRNCIGSSFSMMETVLVLATVAQRFRIRLSGLGEVKPVPSITLRPKGGIRVVLHRR